MRTAMQRQVPPPHIPFGGPNSYGAGGQQQFKPVGQSWRTGDRLPLTLDGSRPAPHPMPSPRIVRDPELVGYKPQGGRAGYGAAMLFGEQAALSPRQETLDMQIAQWRLTSGPYDKNPFTLNGSVPAASPRSSDYRRHIDADLMMQIDDSEPFLAEACRRELARRVADVPRPAFPPADLTPRVGYKPGGNWRGGDAHPLTFDGAIISRRPNKSAIDSTWRMPDKSGIECLGRVSDRNWEEKLPSPRAPPPRGYADPFGGSTMQTAAYPPPNARPYEHNLGFGSRPMVPGILPEG